MLTDAEGTDRPLVYMTELDFPNRYEASVTPDSDGAWTFRIESWSDPYATWRHDAEIKIPAEIDVELMFTEKAHVHNGIFYIDSNDHNGTSVFNLIDDFC